MHCTVPTGPYGKGGLAGEADGDSRGYRGAPRAEGRGPAWRGRQEASH